MRKFNVWVKFHGSCVNGYFDAEDDMTALAKAKCHFSKLYKVPCDDIFVMDYQDITDCEIVTEFAYH